MRTSPPARRPRSRRAVPQLLHRAGKQPLDEIALEREEDRKRDRQRDERRRGDDLDVRSELTELVEVAVAAAAPIVKLDSELEARLRGANEVTLFSGKDLAGWRPIGDAKWTVEDGAIHGQSGGGAHSFLATEKTYGDFELDVDVKLLDKGNSGIQIRSHQDEKGKVFGYQIEIDPSERAWSGGLYDEGRRGWLQDLSKSEAGRKALVQRTRSWR